ncbi:MAG: 5-oxoprolinase subunit PxpB [Pseudomonadota bacterium]
MVPAGDERDGGTAPRFLPFGDAALVVEFGDRVDRTLSARVLALDAAVAAARASGGPGGALAGVVETVPTFRSLALSFDPLVTDAAALEMALTPLVGQGSEVAGAARVWTLPACYEGTLAPDLADVAERAGTTPARVVEMHAGLMHHVYMIGFLPGCPYMGDLPAMIDFPRRSDPRVAVPAGSVAIAVGLTVIYPVESPGGWHLIGRCPARLFDPAGAPGAEERPALLAPGDAVCFEPVGEAEYARIARAASEGDWAPESRPRETGA